MDEARRDAETGRTRRPGRPYDHSGDAEILAVTLDALSEHGYEQVTLDLVALRTGRAKTTVYRRWPTKLDLVVAAVRAVGPPPEAPDRPDTGSVRSHQLALVATPRLGGPERRLVLFDGLAAAARSHPALAEVVRTTVTAPYVGVYEVLLERALVRGQIEASHAGSLALVAQVIPAMASQRRATGPVGRDYFVDVVDHVVQPSLGHTG